MGLVARLGSRRIPPWRLLQRQRNPLRSPRALRVPGLAVLLGVRACGGFASLTRRSGRTLRCLRRPGTAERARPSSPPGCRECHGRGGPALPQVARHSAARASARAPGRGVVGRPAGSGFRKRARAIPVEAATAGSVPEHTGASAGRCGATSTPPEPPRASLDPKHNPLEDSKGERSRTLPGDARTTGRAKRGRGPQRAPEWSRARGLRRVPHYTNATNIFLLFPKLNLNKEFTY